MEVIAKSSKNPLCMLVALALGISTLGALYAVDKLGLPGSSSLEMLLMPGLVVGTVLSGGGPHAGNGMIWFVCLIVVNVVVYSFLWWLVVRRMPIFQRRSD